VESLDGCRNLQTQHTAILTVELFLIDNETYNTALCMKWSDVESACVKCPVCIYCADTYLNTAVMIAC